MTSVGSNENDIEDEEELEVSAESMTGAVKLLTFFLENKLLELENEDGVAPLGRDLAAVLDEHPNAEELANWLLERPEVADLFISDSDLQALLDAW